MIRSMNAAESAAFPVLRRAIIPRGNKAGAPLLPPDFVPVDRDPCVRCGTRRDYGCKHFPMNSENRQGSNGR